MYGFKRGTAGNFMSKAYSRWNPATSSQQQIGEEAYYRRNGHNSTPLKRCYDKTDHYLKTLQIFLHYAFSMVRHVKDLMDYEQQHAMNIS